MLQGCFNRTVDKFLVYQSQNRRQNMKQSHNQSLNIFLHKIYISPLVVLLINISMRNHSIHLAVFIQMTWK